MFSFRPEEVRVLGCLIEKRYSTPDNYPLSLNSLVNACNQSSNRDPVENYDAVTVDSALKSLRSQNYALIFTGERVAKFKETLGERLSLSRPLEAVLAELMLRGPQTAGELRSRTARMFEFPDLSAVEAVLQELAERELVVQLVRQPGKREARWAHQLCGPVDPGDSAPLSSSPSDLEERVAALEATMAEVLRKLDKLLENA
ncbi:YceH family protein [bacterium]|nr:YceH family protein [bacterium]